MEFDGAAFFRVSYGAESGGRELSSLLLRVPLRSEVARFFQMRPTRLGSGFADPGTGAFPFPGADGDLLFSSALVYEKQRADRSGPWRMTVGSFLPFLWVGNDDAGLSYMADSDRGWIPTDEHPAITLRRRAADTVWDFHIVSQPVRIDAERTFEISFEPTPVCELPADWRHAGKYRFISDGAGWAEGMKNPYTPEAFKRTTRELQADGYRVCPHLDTAGFNWGMDSFRKQVAAERAGGNPFGRSRIDFGVYSHAQWKEAFDVDGVYYDTCHFFPNHNPVAGTAYTLPDGRLQPGWTVFGQREYFKRSAIVFGDLGVDNWTWGNIFCGAQMSGWQFAVTDYEGHTAPPGETWFRDSFYTVRVMTHPGKWGVIRMHGMGEVKREAWKETPLEAARLRRRFYAEFLPVGARKSWGGSQPQAIIDFPVQFRGLANPIPEGNDRDITFFPYWETALHAGTGEGPDDLLLAMYRKKDRELLIILSNFTGRKLVEHPVSIPLAPFGVATTGTAKVWDAEAPILPEGGRFAPDPLGENWTREKYYRWMHRGGIALLEPQERRIGGRLEDGRLHLTFTVEPNDFRIIRVNLNHPNQKEN